MALSGYIKNFRFGSTVGSDDTATPITLTFIYEPGDFSVDNLMEGAKNTTDYKDRGDFQTLAFTDQAYPTWSNTLWATALIGAVGAGNVGIPDLLLKVGGYAAGVSTLGAGASIPWTFDIVYTLEGTDVGDSADTTLSLDDNRGTLAFSEGDPSQFSVSATCYGTYTFA